MWNEARGPGTVLVQSLCGIPGISIPLNPRPFCGNSSTASAHSASRAPSKAVPAKFVRARTAPRGTKMQARVWLASSASAPSEREQPTPSLSEPRPASSPNVGRAVQCRARLLAEAKKRICQILPAQGGSEASLSQTLITKATADIH